MTNLSSLEYTLELCKMASDIIGVNFTKTTASRLQRFAEEEGTPFVALVGLTEDSVKNDSNSFLPVYDLAFVTILETEFEATDEEITQAQIDADKITKRFRYLLDKNKYVTITDFSTQELFRNGSFSGIGKAFSLTITLPDLNDYCDLLCNTDMENPNNC